MNVNCRHKINSSAQSPLLASSDRLDSWKQIAVYLDREVRTVQRWEKYEGLPVRRHIHLKANTVYASKKEIDLWLADRGHTMSEPHVMQKCSKHTTNGLNPPPDVARQMLGAFSLLLATVAKKLYKDSVNEAVRDVRMTPSDPEVFTQRPQSEREVRTRQLVTHRGCRALSLDYQRKSVKSRNGSQSH